MLGAGHPRRLGSSCDLLAPWIAPYDPIAAGLAGHARAAVLAHPFGTDNFGRDILSRVIWGTRVDLQIGVHRRASSRSHRHDARRDRRLFRRLRRHLAHARRRRGPGLSVPRADAGDHRHPRAGADELLHRHGAGRLGLLRAAGARADADPEGQRFRHGGREPGLRPCAHHVPPPPAELHRRLDRLRHVRRGARSCQAPRSAISASACSRPRPNGASWSPRGRTSSPRPGGSPPSPASPSCCWPSASQLLADGLGERLGLRE